MNEITRETLIEAFKTHGNSCSVARALKKNDVSILKLLQTHKLEHLLPKGDSPDEIDFRKTYEELKGCKESLQTYYGVGLSVLTRWLIEFGIDASYRKNPEPSEVLELLKKHKTYQAVGKLYGVTGDTVSGWLDKVNKKPEDCVSLAEAARQIGVTKMAVTLWIKNNSMRHEKDTVGRKYIPVSEITRIIQKRNSKT